MIGNVTDDMKQRVAIGKRQYELYHECREIREEINYDNEEMQTLLNKALHGEGPEHQGKLTPSQQNVFEAIKITIYVPTYNNHFICQEILSWRGNRAR